jgi:hypothetical protein
MATHPEFSQWHELAWYKFLVRLVVYCRVSVIVILAGWAFLQINQGAEIAIGLGDENWWLAYFIVAVSFWAWQSWFWSRVILNDRFHGECGLDGFRKFAVHWFARLLGTLAFGAAILSLWRNEIVEWGLWILVAVGVLSVAYWIFRRKIYLRIYGVNLPILAYGNFSMPAKVWLGFSAVVIGGTAIWAISSPLTMGFEVGSGAIVFLALASIAVVGSFLTYWPKRHGFPLVVFAILLAAIWSGFNVNDNHEVRRFEKKSLTSMPLGKALENWLAKKNNGKVIRDENDKVILDKDKKQPFVIVATSGGGLRAAYWTATVLGALQDADPKFRKQLFAISGVSGGSLGAVVFNGLLASNNFACPKSIKHCFETLGQKALSADFLAPSVTAMMYGDLIHRFLPIGFSDRATALERGWETQWNTEVGNELMAKSFRKLWRTVENADENSVKLGLPALLLNGTHQETGRRIITSNLKIDSQYFPDTFDFFAEDSNGSLVFAPGEISAATAAHNSARFSYISPAGTLKTGGHILDGGYFENYGAQTLHELLDAVLDGPGSIKLWKEQPILIIQITNDPTAKDILADNMPKGGKDADSLFNEIVAPIFGLANTREARGVAAAKKLKNKVELLSPRKNGSKTSNDTVDTERKVHYAHFRLFGPSKEDKKSKNPVLGLGWVMSKNSQCSMLLQLRAVKGNRLAFEKVIDVLNRRDPDINKSTEKKYKMPDELVRRCDKHLEEKIRKKWKFPDNE